MNNYEKYVMIFADALEMDKDSVIGLKYKEGAWDSVGHMSLIASLEDAFGLEFEPDDIIEMDSFDKGIAILGKYGIAIR